MNHDFSLSAFFSRLCGKGRLAGFLCLSALLIFALAMPNAAQAKGNPKYASLIMDADTGMVLYQSNGNKSLHPASLTKVMTLMMVFDALESGRLRLRDRVYISRRAASMPPSKIGMPAGSSIRVQDAIYALITKSANDIAVALAERLAGTESQFAEAMTVKARGYGMSRTKFRNASGLHDPRQISTARDMAKMARILVTDYANYYSYFSSKSFTYRGKTYKNHNRLLGKYQGMDGLKTGYIRASGFNLIASAVRNNRRIIGVVFGGRTAKSRNAHMSKLLDRGFAKMNEIRVASAKAPLPPRKPGILLAYAHLNALNPTQNNEESPNDGVARWAKLNTALQNGVFGQMIGEGDFDPAVSRRLETGLLAIAAHRGEPSPLQRPFKEASFVPGTRAIADARAPESWAIQVGAFKSRAKTDQVIKEAYLDLPGHLSNSSPVIVPLKTKTGWMFRARLGGYTKEEALKACSILKECLPIAPQAR